MSPQPLTQTEALIALNDAGHRPSSSSSLFCLPQTLPREQMYVAAKHLFVVSRCTAKPFSESVSFVHSTAALQTKKRSPWNYGRGSYRTTGYNRYTKRTKRIESKKTLLREVSEYAEQLFQSWRDDDNIVWFRKHYWSKGVKLNGFSSHEVRYGRSSRKKHNGFDFCTSDDDDDVDIIFQSVFGGEQGFYWSSCRSEHSKRQQSSGHNHKVFTDWRNATDGETDEDVGADAELQIDLTSERLALGLSASGPLKLEEIKRAYRECAFRWHPDRHRDASKALAEEKFKHCSAAYKSLCDWFASS